MEDHRALEAGVDPAMAVGVGEGLEVAAHASQASSRRQPRSQAQESDRFAWVSEVIPVCPLESPRPVSVL